ncbi:MAG: DUF742 domain-containing protein [Pseudonocardia sp.]|nr:DUF742 domain-containing protein [Pseudonocardia sp.]
MSPSPKEPSDDDVLIRPFLAVPYPTDPGVNGTGSHPTGHSRAARAGAASPEANDGLEVRPYVMTGGRARGGTDLPWETLVITSSYGRTVKASFEIAGILRLCEHMQSVAEVSAHLRIPIGVARVLVADLVSDGRLEAGTPPPRHAADDVEFIERLMQGVAAL